MLKATPTERDMIRLYLIGTSDGQGWVHLADNGDGTWQVDIAGVLFEAPSAAQGLRELADILEES